MSRTVVTPASTSIKPFILIWWRYFIQSDALNQPQDCRVRWQCASIRPGMTWLPPALMDACLLLCSGRYGSIDLILSFSVVMVLAGSTPPRPTPTHLRLVVF